MIIEWNVHIFSSDTQRYPFHPRASYIPDTSRLSPHPLEEYMAHMRSQGIDRAVLVHPEPYGDDHRLVLDCLDREPERFLATTLFYPRDGDAPQRLTKLVREQPKIVATRFHAHRGKTGYFDTFEEEGVRMLWEAAASLGLVVELHIGPNYATQVAKLIRAFPNTPVLIDHLAEPHMGNAVEFADVLALAQYDNVYMKLSGLNHFADDAPLYSSAGNFTRLVSNAFGAEHLVWGSGSPQIVDAHLAHFTSEERDKVRGGNLLALLPWPDRHAQ